MVATPDRIPYGFGSGRHQSHYNDNDDEDDNKEGLRGSHVTRECDGAEQGVFRLARIEAGVLYDDRYI